MSAVVCGKRSSSFFEELPSPTSSASKRIRYYSPSSPARFSPTRHSSAVGASSAASVDRSGGASSSSALDRLRSLFPEMDDQTILRELAVSGNDLDFAIERLNQLRIRHAEESLEPSGRKLVSGVDGTVQLPQEESASGMNNLPANGSEWVELFVRQISHASDIDDARARASEALQALEKDITARARAEAVENLHKENMMLKEQVEALLRDNNILKRAVAIQHERQKEYDERSNELEHLKQLVVQYQEQLRNLEISNYTLTMHLRQAQQSSSIPGRFHPDVF